MRSQECIHGNASFGMRSWECVIGNASSGMRSRECIPGNASFGMRFWECVLFFHLTKYFIEEKTNAAVLYNMIVLNHKQCINLFSHYSKGYLCLAK